MIKTYFSQLETILNEFPAVRSYDLRGNIPAFLTITDGKVHDVKAAPLIPIEPAGIYVVDRAYIDFDWLRAIDETDAFFATRHKGQVCS